MPVVSDRKLGLNICMKNYILIFINKANSSTKIKCSIASTTNHFTVHSNCFGTSACALFINCPWNFLLRFCIRQCFFLRQSTKYSKCECLGNDQMFCNWLSKGLKTTWDNNPRSFLAATLKIQLSTYKGNRCRKGTCFFMLDKRTGAIKNIHTKIAPSVKENPRTMCFW